MGLKGQLWSQEGKGGEKWLVLVLLGWLLSSLETTPCYGVVVLL